jgi:hypothetical protein
MLRSACVGNPLLTVSSLAIIARSATQILLAYRAIYRTRVYNLAWPQLRRVVTCGQLILQCYWRYELQKEEAETMMRIVFELLDTLQARWRSASTVRASLTELTKGLGEWWQVADTTEAQQPTEREHLHYLPRPRPI